MGHQSVIFFLCLTFLVSVRAPPYDFKLSCQLPSRWVRMVHIQDVSPSMTPYITAMNGGAIEAFDMWMRGTFYDDAVVGLMHFTNKAAVTTNPSDVCAAMDRTFSTVELLADYASLPTNVGFGTPTRSQLDALWMATQLDWDTPLNRGRRVAVLYSDTLPQEPPTVGLPAFNPALPCNDRDYPSVAAVVTELNAQNVHVVLVVAPEHFAAHKALFSGLGSKLSVVPLSLDAETLEANMFAAMDELYCGVIPPQPTNEPAVDTDPVTLPPQTTTETKTCSEDAILQMLHLQDMSWSYTNDLANMKAKFPQLLSDLETQFFKREVALGTFVDKPMAPVGYGSDYCYREDVLFTEDASVFTTALNAAKIKSGRDWKESQYDAIRDGIESSNLGWETANIVDGHHVLRVVLMATDAGPHVQGDVIGLPPAHVDGCHYADYPTPETLNALFLQYNVYPIIVVTSDIFNYWTNKMVGLSAAGKVLRLADPVEDVIAAIEEALEEVCGNSRR